jgi:hypothetical protein
LENHRLDISSSCSDLLFCTVLFLFAAVLIFRFLLTSHGIMCFADVVCSVANEVSRCLRFRRITMSSNIFFRRILKMETLDLLGVKPADTSSLQHIFYFSCASKLRVFVCTQNHMLTAHRLIRSVVLFVTSGLRCLLAVSIQLVSSSFRFYILVPTLTMLIAGCVWHSFLKRSWDRLVPTARSIWFL